MGPEYNFVSTCGPEILPDRLEFMAYIFETGFLFDDMIDGAESPMAAFGPYMADVLYAYNVAIADGEVDSSSCSPATRMAAGIFKEMLAVDAEGAKETFGWLRKWGMLMLSQLGGQSQPRDFDEYLEYRRVDVGSQFAFALVIFGMGLRIPEDQQHMCLELSRPSWLQNALANDWLSWEREYKAATDNKQDFISNAIWFLMKKHSITCDEAKAVCRDKAKQYAEEYAQVVRAAKARDDLCRNAKIYLHAQQLVTSGNIVWGLQSPRYNTGIGLSPKQLEMAKAIWADDTIGWSKGVGRRKEASGTAEDPDIESSGVVASGAVQPDMGAAREVPKLSTEARRSHPLPTARFDILLTLRQALEAPSRYLDSLPAKGIRDKATDALNIWFRVSATTATAIKQAVNLLHGASLMVDDIEDSSQLRRGKPATHIVFGTAQTINASGYRVVSALAEVRKLDSESCIDIFCDELRNLYIGQSHDVSWTHNVICPTEDEYMAMVDGKTASLFRMLARLLDAKSDSPTKPDMTLLTRFMTLLGRLFQIRDDYMNLTSDDYTKQKGFCEDFDEGKYSLPLIHALGACGTTEIFGIAVHDAGLLRSLLSQRHLAGRMSLHQKKLFLEHLKARGSLKYTRQTIGKLQNELKRMAEGLGMLDNETLKELLQVLNV